MWLDSHMPNVFLLGINNKLLLVCNMNTEFDKSYLFSYGNLSFLRQICSSSCVE